MNCNVGPNEQVFRIAVGGAATAVAVFVPSLGRWRLLLGLWGIANLATAVTRYCPSNALFGINNCEGREFVHFDERLSGFRGKFGHRLNELQHEVGATAH